MFCSLERKDLSWLTKIDATQCFPYSTATLVVIKIGSCSYQRLVACIQVSPATAHHCHGCRKVTIKFFKIHTSWVHPGCVVVEAAFPHLLTALSTAPPVFPQPSEHRHTELCYFLLPAGTRAGTTDRYVATSCLGAASLSQGFKCVSAPAGDKERKGVASLSLNSGWCETVFQLENNFWHFVEPFRTSLT